MSIEFTKYTVLDAPEAAKPLLEKIEGSMGFVPNLYATMAESNSLLTSYLTVNDLFNQSNFDATGYLVVAMTASRLNDCRYCMGAHTVSSQMFDVDQSLIQSLRKGEVLKDPKLEALRVFTIKMLETKGKVEAVDLDQFLAAGWTKAHAMDVIVGLALKVLSNFTNSLAHIELDEQWQKGSWNPSEVTQ